MNALPVNPWSTNMYAPKWASITPQLPGWCDVEFDFNPVTITLAPGAQSLKNILKVDQDADYLTREIIALPIGGEGTINPQDLKFRLIDGDGQYITSDWVTLNDINGPVGPAVLPLRRGSEPYVDVWNQSANASAVVMIGFKGFKRSPCTTRQADIPAFTPQSKRFCKPWDSRIWFEEYEYFFEFVNGVLATAPPWAMNLQPQTPNGVFQKLPLRTDHDASFLWRGVSGMIMSKGGPAPIPGEWFLRFYDCGEVPLATEIKRPGLLPAIAGPDATMVLSNGGGRMSPHWPEVYIPRGGVVSVDIALLTPATVSVQFSLRGVKVYGEELCT
jgi:hypothetical protein